VLRALRARNTITKKITLQHYLKIFNSTDFCFGNEMNSLRELNIL